MPIDRDGSERGGNAVVLVVRHFDEALRFHNAAGVTERRHARDFSAEVKPWWHRATTRRAQGGRQSSVRVLRSAWQGLRSAILALPLALLVAAGGQPWQIAAAEVLQLGVAFDATGSLLAAASGDLTVTLWDVRAVLQP